jgi:hypothetical protein
MKMNPREERANANDSICRDDGSDSIETDEKELHSVKSEEVRISKVRRMRTDRREAWENVNHG